MLILSALAVGALPSTDTILKVLFGFLIFVGILYAIRYLLTKSGLDAGLQNIIVIVAFLVGLLLYLEWLGVMH